MSEDIRKRIRRYEKELEELKDKYGLNPVVTLEFPQYRKLPAEVLLALEVIKKHDHKYMLSYKEKEEK